MLRRSNSLRKKLLRHTRSQHWYDAGINLEERALLQGYSQLTTTLIYTFFDVNKKRAAIEKALRSDDPFFMSEPPMLLDEDIIKKLYGL